MSNQEKITFTLPTAIKATGSGQDITIETGNWEDTQGFGEYLLTYACGVILQRASAGKADDKEKAEKAVQAAIARLQSGLVPSGGGFTKLTPTEYAMKEVLTAKKVKFEKGESVPQCLLRLATKLTEREENIDDETHKLAVDITLDSLILELENDEVYKSALKARTAKAKANKAGGLIGKL